jgi:hypothetical protein
MLGVPLLLVLLVSSCKQEREELAIFNQTSTHISVYVGATTSPSELTTDASPGESTGIPYGAHETFLFGLITLHDASFRREFSTGLTVADGRGRSLYLSLADLERRRTHPRASVYRIEIDARDFPP